jgi:hypothetical protein
VPLTKRAVEQARLCVREKMQMMFVVRRQHGGRFRSLAARTLSLRLQKVAFDDMTPVTGKRWWSDG